MPDWLGSLKSLLFTGSRKRSKPDLDLVDIDLDLDLDEAPVEAGAASEQPTLEPEPEPVQEPAEDAPTAPAEPPEPLPVPPATTSVVMMLPPHVEEPMLPPHIEPEEATTEAEDDFVDEPIDDQAEPPRNGAFRLTPPKPGMLKIREAVHPLLRTILSVLPFAIVAIWWFTATSGGEAEFRRVAPTVLPSPVEVAGQIGTLIGTGQLFQNILVSLTRVIAGFAIAIAIAFPLGILMGASGKTNATFNLSMTVLSYLPVPAIVPLTMAWWGSGEKQKIGFLALVTFCGMLPQIVRAISAVEHKYVLSAYSQGATPRQIISRVMIPIAMPDIFAAVRMCLGIGWTYIILVEVIKAGEGVGGVGNLIMVYHRLGHMAEVYLTVVAIMLVGAALDAVLRRCQKSTFPWKVMSSDESR